MEQDLNNLFSLFDAKEAEKTNINREIAIILSPTLLTAIFELLELPNEAVVWRDFVLSSNCLIVDVLLSYDPSKPMSQYLKLVTNQQETTESTTIQRVIQLGLLVARLFDPKDDIKKQLLEMALENSQTEQAAEPTSLRLDMSDLSDDQVRSLMAYRMINKDTKQ